MSSSGLPTLSYFWMLRRFGCLLAAVLGLVSSTSVVADSSRGDLTLINGRMYADLGLWGARQGLRSRWNATTGELRVTNQWTRLEFKSDTARVEFNGALVWLEYPVALERGRPYIAQRDIDLTLMPLLKPSKLSEGKKVRRIALSAGHGGKDPGNMEGARQEKTYTLKLAKELAQRLRAAGFEVIQVRERDEFIALDDRPETANRLRADLYIALHFNGTGRGARSPTAQGAETFALTLPNGRSTHGGNSSGPQPGNRNDRHNLLLAYQIHRAILNAVPFMDRGVKRANFAELRGVRMPAAYLECGFMDHPNDLPRIVSDRERGKLADAIVAGIRAYQRQVERP